MLGHRNQTLPVYFTASPGREEREERHNVRTGNGNMVENKQHYTSGISDTIMRTLSPGYVMVGSVRKYIKYLIYINFVKTKYLHLQETREAKLESFCAWLVRYDCVVSIQRGIFSSIFRILMQQNQQTPVVLGVV